MDIKREKRNVDIQERELGPLSVLSAEAFLSPAKIEKNCVCVLKRHVAIHVQRDRERETERKEYGFEVSNDDRIFDAVLQGGSQHKLLQHCLRHRRVQVQLLVEIWPESGNSPCGSRPASTPSRRCLGDASRKATRFVREQMKKHSERYTAWPAAA